MNRPSMNQPSMNQPAEQPLHARAHAVEARRPFLLALILGILTAISLAQVLVAERSAQMLPDALLRYWDNPLCLLIAAIGWLLLLYGLLQALGVRVDRRLLIDAATNPEPLAVPRPRQRLLGFIAGRETDPGRSHYLKPQLDTEARLLLHRRLQWEHLEPLRFGVWALPILGFIGTVIGISGAIEGLQGLMGSGAGGDGGFEAVTGELYFAFDTTLVGLVLMLPLALLLSWLRGQEQRLDDLLLALHRDPRPTPMPMEPGQ
jgi:hypothetical protein